jgi:hypothetical protein
VISRTAIKIIWAALDFVSSSLWLFFDKHHERRGELHSKSQYQVEAARPNGVDWELELLSLGFDPL